MTRDAEEAARFQRLADAVDNIVAKVARYERVTAADAGRAHVALRAVQLSRSTGGGGETVAKCPLCRAELDLDEMEPEDTGGLTTMRPDGAGVCSECYGRWHDYSVLKNRNGQLEALLLDKAPTGATGGEYERGLEDAAKCCDERAYFAGRCASTAPVRDLSRTFRESEREARDCAKAIRALARNEGGERRAT